MNHYLALDFGAESGRAIVGSLEGDRLTLEEVHRFENRRVEKEGRLWWDLAEQWRNILEGLKKASEFVARRGGRIESLAVDTWGVDFGLIGGDGEVVRAPFCYRDLAMRGMVEEAGRMVPLREIYGETGIQIIQINTLYQLLAMKRLGFGELGRAARLLFMPDLFNYLLTGNASNEETIASTSQFYDPVRKDWARGLLAKLGLGEASGLLGEVAAAGSIVGTVKEELARGAGLGDGVKVVAVGGHDTACAVAAVPARGEGWCYLSSGTWSLLGVEIGGPIVSDASYEMNFTNESGVFGTTRFLKNVVGLWLIQELRRAFALEGREYSYDELTRMAGESEGMRTVIDPDWAEFLNPGDLPGKIRGFCTSVGEETPGTDGEFVRCCLDSLVLAYRRNLEGLERILGKSISVIHVVGGGCKNELLNQLTADVCGREVVAGPVEATAIGNLLLQGVAGKRVGDLAHLREIVRGSFGVKVYKGGDIGRYAETYKRYLGVVGRRA